MPMQATRPICMTIGCEQVFGMKPDVRIPQSAEDLSKVAVPGRCIYCDQRCDVTAIAHAYCLELQEGDDAMSALSRLDCELTTPAAKRAVALREGDDESVWNSGGVIPSSR